MQTALAVERVASWQAAFKSEAVQRSAIFALSLLCALLVWTLLAWWVGKPAFLPSPTKTLKGAIELVRNGELQVDVAVSFAHRLPPTGVRIPDRKSQHRF
jgi:ABC-type nitrate/sulfonate/bicarbonate transport system permease component